MVNIITTLIKGITTAFVAVLALTAIIILT